MAWRFLKVRNHDQLLKMWFDSAAFSFGSENLSNTPLEPLPYFLSMANERNTARSPPQKRVCRRAFEPRERRSLVDDWESDDAEGIPSSSTGISSRSRKLSAPMASKWLTSAPSIPSCLVPRRDKKPSQDPQRRSKWVSLNRVGYLRPNPSRRSKPIWAVQINP